MVTKIHIRKERLKFSAAHMTVFEDGSKERLHGHGYATELTVQTKKMIPYSVFKTALEKVTSQWDEKVLVAVSNKHFKKLASPKESFSFSLCGKNYLIPVEEVVPLNTENITSEELSRLALGALLDELGPEIKKILDSVTLRIDESSGQGASTTWSSQ